MRLAIAAGETQRLGTRQVALAQRDVAAGEHTDRAAGPLDGEDRAAALGRGGNRIEMPVVRGDLTEAAECLGETSFAGGRGLGQHAETALETTQQQAARQWQVAAGAQLPGRGGMVRLCDRPVVQPLPLAAPLQPRLPPAAGIAQAMQAAILGEARLLQRRATLRTGQATRAAPAPVRVALGDAQPGGGPGLFRAVPFAA